MRIYGSRVDPKDRSLLMLSVIVAVCGLFILFFRFSQQSRRVELVNELESIQEEMEDYYTMARIVPLDVQLATAREDGRILRQELGELLRHVNTLSVAAPENDDAALPEERRIEFKVALFNARNELQDVAAKSNVILPEDIGLDSIIGAEENTETRLRQLNAVVKLMHKIFTQPKVEVVSITSLEPKSYELALPEVAALLEYPTALELKCTYAQLFKLIAELQKPEDFFMLRNLRIDRQSDSPDSKMLVAMTCGAMLPVQRIEPSTDELPEEELPEVLTELPLESGTNKEFTPFTPIDDLDSLEITGVVDEVSEEEL